MKSKIFKISIASILLYGFGIAELSADEYRAQRSNQMKMMERHQDERKELRETHKAELDEIRELHRKELNLLLNKQEEERSAERSTRLMR